MTALSTLLAVAPGPPLPHSRGPVSDHVLGLLTHGTVARFVPAAIDDPLDGDDSALALYLCNELVYRGFSGVPDAMEWDPLALAVRAELERRFVGRLREMVGPAPEVRRAPDVVSATKAAITTLIADADGPSLSGYMAELGTAAQMREFAVHRSAYQLKEADPHTFGIPRLSGEAKAAMVYIQSDEYGSGVTADMHASLFADTLQVLGLDDRYGAYLDVLPGITLATTNLVSLFGLHRQWRGALVGHLAVFEMTSVTPMERYSSALRRLGFGPRGRRFYDVHVVADADHEVVALERMVSGFVADEPERANDVVWGAMTLMALEQRFAEYLLGRWASGRSSLLGSPGR